MPINLQPSTGTTGTTGTLKKETARGEGSRRMPTNSRPPLSHRIRASFEGKRSQDLTSPQHANFSVGSPTDSEALRQAIDHAISGDAFQAGIAYHIAKMLKPQIKTALDTIEPLVNAVLQHEILLKKTNASVESVLLRLDSMTNEDGAVDPTKARLRVHGAVHSTKARPRVHSALSSHPIPDPKLDVVLPVSHTSASGTPGSLSNEQPITLLNRNVSYTAGKLSQISESLDLNNNRLGRVVEGIAEINNLLSNERLDSVKETSEKYATNTSVMQSQLAQLQESVRVIITRIGFDLGKNVKAINDRLAEGLPGSETAVIAPISSGGDADLLRMIFSELEVLKGNLEARASSHDENLILLKVQISSLQSTLDGHKVLLGEIKDADHSADVLAGIQKSNESHESHTAILEELKGRNAQPIDVSIHPTVNAEDAETLQAILAEVQKSNETHDQHVAALEGIKSSDISAAILAEVQKSNDSHIAHAAALENLKNAATPPPEPTTSIDLGGLETKIDSIIETNTSILAEVQRSNESHISHTAVLESIKALPTPPPESRLASASVDLGGLEKDMGSIIEKLDNHAAVLDEIKMKDVSVQGSIDPSAFDAHFGSITSLLEAHSAVLDEIKVKDIPIADVGPIISILEAHSVALNEIKSKDIPIADFSSITSMLEAYAAILEEIKSKDIPIADFAPITSLLEAHAATLEEIKSKDIPIADLAPITSLLEAHAATLEEIKSKDIPIADLAPITSILESHTLALNEIQTKDIPPTDFTPIIATLEVHTATLEEIKSKDIPIADLAPITSILESHTLALNEIQTKDIPPTDFTPIIATLEVHTATLEEIKSKDIPIADLAPITSILESHTLALNEIQTKDIPPTDFTPIIATLENHTTTLEEIKAKDEASSIDFSPVTSILESHTSALDELKSKDIPTTDFTPITSLLEAHSTILEDIKTKDGTNSIDFSPIISILECHSAVLNEIKSKDIQDSIAPAAINMDALDTHFNSITGILAAQTAALDEIKFKDVSSNSSVPAEINTESLDKYFDSITSMLEAHTTALDEIKSKDVTSAWPVEFHTAAFDGRFNTLTSLLESHTAALGELKLKIDDFSSSELPRGDITGFESLEPHITAIKSTLDAHMVVVSELKSETLAKNDMDAKVVDNVLEPHIMAIKNTLEAHTAILGELKSNTSPNAIVSPEAANDALPTILETLSSHTNLLTKIKNSDVSDEILTALHELQESNSTAFNSLKESDVSDEILTALHTCNDSQEKLDKSLLELQTAVNTSGVSEQSGEKSIAPSEEIMGPVSRVDLCGLEMQISAVVATLEGQNLVLGEIKDATNSGLEAHNSHITTLSEIKDAANASNESHSTHAATLGVIRDATAALTSTHATQISTLSELHEAMNTSNESHNAHTHILGEIRDATATSNEANLTHATTLNELKEAINVSNESHASHATALAELKSIQLTQLPTDTIVESTPEPVLDFSILDTQLTTVITTLESQTSTLREIKEIHTSHSNTLGEIKDATVASNELHTSHATILSEIKDATAQAHGINEVLSTHTGILESLKEGCDLKHDEVRGDIDSLKKFVEESSNKHEENLSKHGELIKEHADLARENHDGLNGTIAGLALGGILGAGAVKAIEGEEKDDTASVEDKMPEEPIQTEPEVQVEEEKTPDAELTPMEPEAPVEEDKATDEESPSIESEALVEEESVPETKELEPNLLVEEDTSGIEKPSPIPEEVEVQSETEAPAEEETVMGGEKAVDEEKTVDEEKSVEEEEPGEQEPEPEVITTETEVMAGPQENVSIPDAAQIEPELEPEANVEESPVEEMASAEPEKAVEDVIADEKTSIEEEVLAGTVETTEETPSFETQNFEEDVPAKETSQEEPVVVEPEVTSEPEPNAEDSTPASNTEPISNEQLEETDNPVQEVVEEPVPVEDTGAVENLQTNDELEVVEKAEHSEPEILEEPVSNQDTPAVEEPQITETEPISEENSVPGLSKDEQEPEQSAVVEEIPVEEEVVGVEDPKEEADGEIKGDQVQKDLNVVDGDNLKSSEETEIFVEQEKPMEGILPDTEDNELQPNNEEESTEEVISDALIENSPTSFEEIIPLVTEEAPTESEVIEVSNLSDTPTENPIAGALTEDVPSTLQDCHSLRICEKLPEPEEIAAPSSNDAQLESEENTVIPDANFEAPISESIEEISVDHIETPIEHGVVESSSEDSAIGVETETDQAIELEEEVLDTETKNVENEGVTNETMKDTIEASHEETIPEPVVENERPVPESDDQDQSPEESEGKALETKDLDPTSEENSIEALLEENLPEKIVETEVAILSLNNLDQTPIENEEKSQVGEHKNEEILKEPLESVIELPQKDNSLETVEEAEKPLSGFNDQNQTSIDSEGNSMGPPQLSEPSIEISSGIAENPCEPSQGKDIPEPSIELGTPVLELKDQDQPLVESEESITKTEISEAVVLDLESLEQPPLIESEEKSLEIETQEPSNDIKCNEIEENVSELHEEHTPDPAIISETPVLESGDEEKVLVQTEESPLEPQLSEPAVREMENSEEKLPSSVDNEEVAIEVKAQDSIDESVTDNENPSIAQESEEAQNVVEDEELPNSTEEQVIEISNEDSTAEIQTQLPNQEEQVIEVAREENTLELEVKNENPTNMSESSENVQIVTDIEEKPILTDEQVDDASSEGKVSESDSLVPEPDTSKDSEDIKARDEITALTAKVARILAEEERKSIEPIVEEIRESEELNSQLDGDIIYGDEPMELDVKQIIEESIYTTDEQSPVESQETLQGGSADEPIGIETSELQEDKIDSLIGEELSIEHNLQESVEESVVESTDLEEGFSPEEPEIANVEDVNLTSTEDLAQPEEITKIEMQDEENETLLGENIPEILGKPEENHSDIQPIAEQIPEIQSAPVEAPIETEDHESEGLSDDHSSPSAIEILPVQLEFQSSIDSEAQILEDKDATENVALESESKDSESEEVLENSSAPENSITELEPIIESHTAVEGGNEKLDNEISPVEHTEVVETDSCPQDHSKDAGSVEVDESLPAESKDVHESLGDLRELESESIIPESTSDEVGSCEMVEENNTVEDETQELVHVADVQSTEPYHEDAANHELQHDGESTQDEIACEVPLPSDSVRDEPVQDEPVQDEPVQKESVQEESVQDEPIQDESVPLVVGEHPHDQFLSAQNSTGNESHQRPEDILAIGNQIFESSSTVPNGVGIEPANDPILKELLVAPEEDFLSEENILIESEPDFKEKTEADEVTLNMPQDQISHDQIESQIVSESEPQIKHIVEDVHAVVESSELHEDSLPFEDETLLEIETIFMKSTNNQVIKDNQSLSDEIPTAVESYLAFEDATSVYSQEFDPEHTMESYRQEEEYPSHEESFEPATFASDYIGTERLEKTPEPEPKITLSSPSYPQDQFSKPYSTQDMQYSDYEPEPEHPITLADQTTQEHDLPTPQNALTSKVSVEAFPVYNESRQSPLSHRFNLGLPMRSTEDVEKIHESPQFDNERTYPTYHQPLRSPVPSRLPMPSSRSTDNVRKTPEIEKSRYDGTANSSRSSQGFNFGLQARNTAPVDHQRESSESMSTRGNVRSLLRQFEGGEESLAPSYNDRSSTASPYDRYSTSIPQPQDRMSNSAQDSFKTSLPRPLDTRSLGKHPSYEEETTTANATP